jgi:hypothetical protein
MHDEILQSHVRPSFIQKRKNKCMPLFLVKIIAQLVVYIAYIYIASIVNAVAL